MFGAPNKGANAYAKVGLETGVLASSPHKLIVMLFEGALIAARAGQAHMIAGETEKKGLAISKAINIVANGLRASLDKSAGQSIAANLDSLYEYINRRMMEANLKNDPALLDEAIALLADLKGTWDAIGDKAAAPVAAAPIAVAPVAPARMMAFDNLAPRRASLVTAG